ITGWASSIISPSRVTTTRSTPWVAGCWGPTFRVMSWVCSSRSALSRTMMPTPVPSAAWKAAPPGCRSLATLLPRFLGSRPGFGLPGQQGELLAQRVALELLGQQQLGQVGVAVEADPEQLGRLPLVPVGAGPQVADRRQVAAVAGHDRPDLEVVAVAGRVDVEDHPDPGRLLVDSAQEVEEVAGQVGALAGQLGHPPPVVRGDGHGQGAEGDVRL